MGILKSALKVQWLCLENFLTITLMENAVDDVFDDVLEQDEVFDEGMEVTGIVFCVRDGANVEPNKIILHNHVL